MGENEYTRRRFLFASRLVIRKTPYNTKDGEPYAAPYPLHPWIDAALKRQKYPYWIPNPDLPSILDYVDGRLNLLRPDTNQYFENGDIVWYSFALTFDVNTNNWMPEYKPLDFIRVGRLTEASDIRGEYSVEAEVGAAYQSLTVGNVTLLDGVSYFLVSDNRTINDISLEEDDGLLLTGTRPYSLLVLSRRESVVHSKRLYRSRFYRLDVC